MRTMSRILAGSFRGLLTSALAAMHQQRAIEARRVLHRYRHLLEAQQGELPLNEVISVPNEEDISGHAHQLDERNRAAEAPALERA